LGVILAFIGSKMLIAYYCHLNGTESPITVIVSLAVIIAILSITVILSLAVSKRKRNAEGT
jgi:predicted tellurium resistance membrane protein TerC